MANGSVSLSSERGGYGMMGGLCALVGARVAFRYILRKTVTRPDFFFFFCWFSVKTCGNFIEVLQTHEVGGKDS